MAPFGEFLNGLLGHAAVRGMQSRYRTETEDAIRVARVLFRVLFRVLVTVPKCICHCPDGSLRARCREPWHVGFTMSRNPSPNLPSLNLPSPPSTPSGARALASKDGQSHPQGATISPEDLAEFQQIYRKEYGVDLTPEEALLKAQQLIELFRILLRPPR